MRAEVRVTDDPGTVAAGLLARAAGAGGDIALTGGSTPRGAYATAAAMDVDWAGATLWFGDERCVGPDDERSNYGMAKEALLDRIPGLPPVMQRIKGELGPADAADDYEALLRDALGDGVHSLDLVLLGLGSDGHCASLFPGKPEVRETERLVVGVPEAGLEPFVPRVSFTLPLIDAATQVVFLVTGADKAGAVARAFSGARDPGTPASLVAPHTGSLVALLDPPAAASLEAAPS